MAAESHAGDSSAPPDAADRLPPYASYSSWVRLLDALSSSFPPLVDETYLSSLKFPESSIKPLRSALRFLGLVARGGRATERLKRLVQALHEGGAVRIGALREMVLQSYRPLFSDDFRLKSTTLDQLRLHFATAGARGQIQQKCSSFFLNLARDAGLELPPELISRAPLALGRYGATTARARAAELQLWQEVSEGRQMPFTFSAEPGVLRDLFPRFDIDWPEKKKRRWFRDFARLVKIYEKGGESLAS